MKPTVKLVNDYWKRQYPLVNLDSVTLAECVAALTLEETGELVCWNGVTDPDAELLFILYKVFNRHNDVCAGATEIVKDKGVYVVEISSQSSISELGISLSTLKSCNKACIYHIEDIDKTILPTLSFDAIADLTGAILQAETVVEDKSSRRGRCIVVQNTGRGGNNVFAGTSQAKE